MCTNLVNTVTILSLQVSVIKVLLLLNHGCKVCKVLMVANDGTILIFGCL